MNEFKKLLGSKPVVFIGTQIKGIDRGWEPKDVYDLLRKFGVDTEIITANSLLDLENAFGKFKDAIYWPVCYNLSEDDTNLSLMEHLEDHRVSFVGASSTSILYSSKLNFKRKANKLVGVTTPDFQIIDATCPTFPDRFEFPAMLKTEFSCNSEGVRKIDCLTDFKNANEELTNLYGQRHFIESWERETESTVAYIPASKTRQQKIAPVGLKINNNAEYIDIPTKAVSALVSVKILSDAERLEHIAMTQSIATGLKLDGHCRIDFIRNSQGELFVIEINFQPFMSFPENRRSYFPNALIKAESLTYEDQIFQILEHAVYRLI